MKIIHTSDWHIGHTFLNYERKDEFLYFFQQLHALIERETPELLLISGDIFHHNNPSAESTAFYFHELMQLKQLSSNLQIIITAGNHDSPSRLQAPAVILDNFNIHIVGCVPKENGEILWDKMLIPIYNHDHILSAVCMAVPFLRRGDYNHVGEEESDLAGIRHFYDTLYEKARTMAGTLPVIATAHIGIVSNNKEETIIGSLEAQASSVFPEGIDYVALGHIHKAYPVNRQLHIRYSGSPLPISMNAINRDHYVLVVDFSGNLLEKSKKADKISVNPVKMNLLRPVLLLPETPQLLDVVLDRIRQIPDEAEGYVELNLLQTELIPDSRERLFAALEEKKMRFVGLRITTPQVAETAQTITINSLEELQQLDPTTLAKQYFIKKTGVEMDEKYQKMLQEVIANTNQPNH
ncbi:MAG: exonuclease SbcCD subunit D C-terminal domain-containing protein [Bacteroidales bacterium]|jgi:exonuclease SbcD|nr:exonuclease SbcCD subunit D C-terminal domain-containing protein [Bacteroidales bacterium]